MVGSYRVWVLALESSWKEYLSQIAKHTLAGDWVKEVAKYLVENEEASND
ncbi:MAG: hypothetical protein NWF04_10115 [Candidatus Bathyarchaeota archaeon]|nr:hypothetical protein [Candidatus Bathyarchaeota archaeon]